MKQEFLKLILQLVDFIKYVANHNCPRIVRSRLQPQGDLDQITFKDDTIVARLSQKWRDTAKGGAIQVKVAQLSSFETKMARLGKPRHNILKPDSDPDQGKQSQLIKRAQTVHFIPNILR